MEPVLLQGHLLKSAAFVKLLFVHLPSAENTVGDKNPLEALKLRNYRYAEGNVQTEKKSWLRKLNITKSDIIFAAASLAWAIIWVVCTSRF